jgi:hypothetical protein
MSSILDYTELAEDYESPLLGVPNLPEIEDGQSNVKRPPG